MMVLWLLILRGIAIEFRNQISNELWTPFWDVVFSLASCLLAIFLGAALGNVVRGVPLDANHEFFLPLWTNFLPGKEVGILDWYTVLVGLFSFFTLALHGTLWVNLKTVGELQRRARRVARAAWFGVSLFTVIVTIASFSIQPHLAASFAAMPAGYVFPALALAGLAGSITFLLKERDGLAFLASCLYIVGMLTSVVFGVFPYVLPSNGDPNLSLTITNASAPAYGLGVGIAWYVPGILLVAAYFTFVYRKFSGKVTLEGGGH
jgi:cytochrome bd ubiquinol oxidase subunit II